MFNINNRQIIVLFFFLQSQVSPISFPRITYVYFVQVEQLILKLNSLNSVPNTNNGIHFEIFCKLSSCV